MTASIHNQVFVSTPLAEPACRAAHTLCTSPGTQDLIPSTELAASSPTFPSAMEQPPVLCLEQGHRDCAQQPSPPSGKEDSLPQHTHNWFFPYSQAAGSRLGRYCWLCLVVDPPVHTGQSPFQQPQARAGQVQELPKEGSVPGTRTSREAFVEPGMGSSTPCLNSKASI